jgi:hypothetical protein
MYCVTYAIPLSIKNHSIPLRSYANGFWIGKVLEELQNLTFLEERVYLPNAVRPQSPSLISGRVADHHVYVREAK